MSYVLEKTTAGQDIVISGWEDGISDNPYEGIADMRNVDNVTIPGEISVAMATETTITQGSISATFTVDPATDLFTWSASSTLEVNTAITVSNSGGGLPAPLAVNTAYYVKSVGGNNFTLSTHAGGTLLNITTTGSGTNTFTTIQMGTPKYYATSPIRLNGTQSIALYFVIDSNGRTWVYDSSFLGGSDTWVYTNSKEVGEGTTSTGNGLVQYKGYLFAFTGAQINVLPVGILSTLATLTTRSNWILGWQTTVSASSHQAIVAVNDDSVYFCDGAYVGSILTAIEDMSGVVASSTGQVFNIANTHTVADGVTTNASPNISSVTAFFQPADIGAVIVGTHIPAGAYIISVTDNKHAVISANATANDTALTFTITSGYVYNSQARALPSFDVANCLAELGGNLLIGGINNYIYPWDRISTGINQSGAISLSENFVSRLVTFNTTTYIFCGYRGRVYRTNGSNVSDYWEIPEYLSNTTNPYFIWTDAIFNRNQLYCGFQVQSNNGITINQYGGLWTIDTNTGKGKLQNQLSYGTYSGYVSALVTNRSVVVNTPPSGDGYGLFIGWNNGTVGGIDIGVSEPYTGGESIIVSDMIPVGQYLTKWTGNNLEFKLSAPLAQGESVALAYRENIANDFTDVPITEGGLAGDISGITAMNFEKIQWLQVQATLTSIPLISGLPFDDFSPGLLNGLARYYQLDGNSTDIVGGFNGTDTAISYSTANGVILEGAGFNGTTSNIVTSGTVSPTDFSIACWFKTSNTGGTNFFSLVNGSIATALGINEFGNPTVGEVNFFLRDSNGVTADPTSGTVNNDNTFHYAVGVKNGNTTSLYIDGLLASTTTQTFTGNFNNMVLGLGSITGEYAGAVDEAGYWTRALSAAEVLQLFNKPSFVRLKEIRVR